LMFSSSMARAGSWDSSTGSIVTSTVANLAVVGGITLAGTGTYEVYSSTVTLNPDATLAPKETWGSHEAALYAGTNPFELPTGHWMDFYYNQTSTYDYTSTPVSETAHGVGFFARGHGNDNNQGFMAAIEGNALCSSTYTTAACVGLIGHPKWDNHGNPARVPGAPIIGVESRIDVTNDGYGSSPYAFGQLINFRPDPYGYGGAPGRRYVMLNEADADLQIFNAGNIFRLSVSTVVSNGDTINVNRALGGAIILTSTGIVTTGTYAFSTPSVNEAAGINNSGGIVAVVNGNLTPGRTITIKASGSNFFSDTGSDVVLGAQGGAFIILSVPSMGIWNQLTPKTK